MQEIIQKEAMKKRQEKQNLYKKSLDQMWKCEELDRINTGSGLLDK